MTLYTLVQDLRTFAAAHPQLKSFAYGPMEEVDIAKRGEDEYPLLYAVPNTVTVDKGQMEIGMDLIVAQPFFDEAREESLMQMLEVMTDLIAFATQSQGQTGGITNRILSEPPYTCEPFLVRFDNALIGWALTLDFGADHVNDFCLVLPS